MIKLIFNYYFYIKMLNFREQNSLFPICISNKTHIYKERNENL